MNKILRSFIVTIILFFAVTTGASAHVVIRPSSVGIGSFQTFTIGVPVEKELPTTGVRLVIPEGMEYVTPNVKPGWTIRVKKTREGESARVTEIEWTAGSIPAGQRDEFLFSAKVPSKETELAWKAYQTYKDGSIVSWDASPSIKRKDEKSNAGPYSVTKVIDDLRATPKPDSTNSSRIHWSTGLTLASFGLSVAALVIALQQRNKDSE